MAAQPQVAVQFRPMRQADVPLVAAMEARAYAFPWTAGIFRDCLGAGYACWVAESPDGLLGYGVLSVGADEAHLLNLCVDPVAQGHGLGRRLLKRMVDLARWHMADRIFLEVRPSNPTAIALYDSEGFQRIGQRPRYYPAKDGREDAIVMALDLVPPGEPAPNAPPA
jgi:ribosomal-protein-alanine N-acetyltransferase